MTERRHYWLYSLLTLTVVANIMLARAEVLAESANPMKGVNPQRNQQFNKKILCPSVAPGRSQVWNFESEIKLPKDVFMLDSEPQITQDDQGSIYFAYQTDSSGTDTAVSFIKINATTGTYTPDSIFASSLTARYYSVPVPTLVKGNRLYATDGKNTLVLNTTTMQQITLLSHEVAAYRPCSYVPFSDNFMVMANFVADYTGLRYLNTSSLQFDTSQPNFSGSFGNDVIIYKNASGVEFPIVVFGGGASVLVISSPYYTFSIPGYSAYLDSYVQDDQLTIHYKKQDQTLVIDFYDANNGTFINSSQFTGAFSNPETAKVFGSKSLAGVVTNQYLLVDLINNKTILEDYRVRKTPRFSIPSNSALVHATYKYGAFVMSLDWDTQTINAMGSFPTDVDYSNSYDVSSPVVGEDCTIYSYLSIEGHDHVIIVFKPLPISNVQPILQCINSDGVGYFSYHNYENKHINIPNFINRNNLSPMGVSPMNDFKANQRGRYFPLSSPVILDGTSFTWTLEDYTLSFNSSDQRLRCPTNVTLAIVFNSTTTSIPIGFPEWTRQAFVNVTEISSSRVHVTSSSINQMDIRIELLISPDPDPEGWTPEDLIREFVFAYSDYYVIAVNELAAASIYSQFQIQIKDVDGVPLASEIYGVNPSLPPQAQPIDQPPTDSQSPTNNNVPPSGNNVPKSSHVSNGVVVSSSRVVMLISLAAITLALIF